MFELKKKRVDRFTSVTGAFVAATATAVFVITPSEAIARGPAEAPAAAPAAVVVPAFDWTGGYVGAQYGNTTSSMDTAFTQPGYTENTSPDPDGWGGGLYGGYNWQGLNNLVYGVEAEYNWTDMEGDSAEIAPDEFYSASIDQTAALRFRVGHAMDNVLPYAAGGLAYASYEMDYMVAGTVNESYSDSTVGWTLGLGAEYVFTNNIIGRIDYRYSDFGSASFDAPQPDAEYEIDLSTNEVRVGLAYRF